MSDKPKSTGRSPRASFGARGFTRMSKTSKNRTVIRVDELKIPKKLGADDFNELCAQYKILFSLQRTAKERLDDIVSEFANWMEGERQQPNRSSDRKHLKQALTHFEKARTEIDKLGPSGSRAMREVSRSVALMLSAEWIRENFPGDIYAPQKPGRGRDGEIPERGGRFIEEDTRNARQGFVFRRPAKTITAMLKTIEAGFDAALSALGRQPGSKGGRKPLTYRHYLIINLAEIWRDLGNQVSTGPKSDFAAFCEGVAVSIGWPTDGMSAAIADALEDWRNLTKTKRR
jgi:hypothetical protein